MGELVSLIMSSALQPFSCDGVLLKNTSKSPTTYKCKFIFQTIGLNKSAILLQRICVIKVTKMQRFSKI